MKTNQQIAAEVLMGQWGNGIERKERLAKAGYNYNAIQSIVNALVAGNAVQPEDEKSEIKITGTETMKVTLDLTKYNSISIEFLNGEE